MIPERFAPVLAELAPLAETLPRRRSPPLPRRWRRPRPARRAAPAPQFDLDLTTDARPPEVKRLLDAWGDAVWTQGERFGTIGAHRRRDDGTFRTVEVTTFRSDAYVDDSRKPHVTFADDIEADLGRRDFTINAMAPRAGARPRRRVDATLVDPHGGVADLAGKVLRTPLAPKVSFDDDPLRMLRAARFIAALRPDASPRADGRRRRARPAARDRVARAHPRRARQADGRRPSVGRTLVPRRHRPGRALPARAAGAASRARPDPPPQGRAEPHDRRGRERAPAGTGRRRSARLRLPHHPPGRAVPRRRQAGDARLPVGEGHDVPPPRRRRRRG